jgi:hypothetical protein
MRLFALLFLVVGTCAFAPNDVTPFDPPAHYREIYDSALACSAAVVEEDAEALRAGPVAAGPGEGLPVQEDALHRLDDLRAADSRRKRL